MKNINNDCMTEKMFSIPGFEKSYDEGETKIWWNSYLPPKYNPAAVDILHWPWCMPVSAGLVISILTSVISPGLSMSTDTLP